MEGAGLAVWWVALAGLVLGGIGAALSLSGRRHNLALKDQLQRLEDAARTAREREARRARLHAVIEQEVTVRWYLTIRNDGHAAAHNFTVSIDGAALDRCPLIAPEDLELARIGTVDPHATVRIPLQTPTAPDHLQLELTWSDASGDLGFYEADLTRRHPRPEPAHSGTDSHGPMDPPKTWLTPAP
jgi:hypothetical protein